MTLANIIVLIIERNAATTEFLHQLLRFEGLASLAVSSEHDARTLIRQRCPDLILLGSLPDQGSLRMVRTIRTDAKSSHIPVTMVSMEPSDDSIVGALDAGADDYLTIPCSGLHLGARIRALLRRTGPRSHERVVRFANIEIFPDSRMVRVGGAVVEFSPCCYGLLNLFVAHPGRIFTREEIYVLLTGNEHAADVRTVDVKILRLRTALSDAKTLIKTVRHRGYMLAEA